MPPVQERAALREVLPAHLLNAAETDLPMALVEEGVSSGVVRVVAHAVHEAGRQIVWVHPPAQRGYVESLYAGLLLDGLFDLGVLDPRVLRVVLGALAEGIRP